MNQGRMKENAAFFRELLKKSRVILYGYRESTLPDLLGRGEGVEVFVWGKRKDARMGDFQVKRFNTLTSAEKIYQLLPADVRFLDHEGINTLFARLPGPSWYLLVRFAFRMNWLVGFPGILRRLVKKELIWGGIITLHSPHGSQRWIVLRSLELQGDAVGQLSLAEEVGVQGFLDFLKREDIAYVVSRFYDKLPKLSREGGDLDILVADEDEHRVKDFLEHHPGDISVGVSSVSGLSYNKMPYYPPLLAKKMLESSVEGPGGSHIPALKEAFLSFAYHVVYHKGPSAGVPTRLPNIVVNQHPQNDYVRALREMAESMGIEVDITLEGLDEYLHQEGWRPKLDSLAIFGLKNYWVEHRFFNPWIRKMFFSGEYCQEVGLGVVVLKERAFQLGLADKMIAMIEKEKFRILKAKRLRQEDQWHATEQLRGGVWPQDEQGETGGLPAFVMVVLDMYAKNILKTYPDIFTGKHIHGRLRKLKRKLRLSFDTGTTSFVHSTDGTYESWEYIEVCFPGETDEIQKALKREHDSRGFLPFLKEKTQMARGMVRYYYKTTSVRLRNFFVLALVGR